MGFACTSPAGGAHVGSEPHQCRGRRRSKKFRNGVERKMYDVMAFARQKTAKGRRCLYVIDLLGEIRQDSDR